MAHTFKPGEVITWTEKAIREGMAERFGFDPLTVDSIKEVPDRCNCGGQTHTNDEECPYTSIDPRYGRNVRESVGHHQWVTLRRSDGTLVLSGAYLNYKPTTFSGAWFEQNDAPVPDAEAA